MHFKRPQVEYRRSLIVPLSRLQSFLTGKPYGSASLLPISINSFRAEVYRDRDYLCRRTIWKFYHSTLRTHFLVFLLHKRMATSASPPTCVRECKNGRSSKALLKIFAKKAIWGIYSSRGVGEVKEG
ncbi:hypothetical protein TNCV_2207501 [Trichonephila clavipes]|uniref:Uncharacterized protein n=1 Tax=Trichonephila clavipes TaxID=2585209 RepID=A0A8X6VFB1_TRICX|nr:hypothetical protein TNCV_2207501 [Trichonephila clavipes]